MKGVLGLGADFFDRLANPANGGETNEAYAARFAELLDRDAELLTASLSPSDLDDGDVDLLPIHAWLWYLSWLATHGTLPGDGFLTALYEDVGDSLLRLLVVEAIVTNPVAVQGYADLRDLQAPLSELPPTWPRNRLLTLLASATGDHPEVAGAAPDEVIDEVGELATALLQIANPVSVATLRALLGFPWPGRAALVRLVDDRLAASGADEDRLAQWRRLLGILPTPPHDVG